MSNPKGKIERARALRGVATTTERMLWSVLRGKQVSGLKFRRQHPIGPFFADFACESHKLVVEIDGGYHDATAESDLSREQFLRQEGWSVLRFTDRDVREDLEAVAIGITKHLGIAHDHRRRASTGSGMKFKGIGVKGEPLPGRYSVRPSRREGGV